jgi:peroxiredoxin
VRSVKGQFEKHGVAIAVISFAQPERLVAYQEHHRWPFLLLADPDREAYHYFNLERLPWYRIFSLSTLKLYFHLLRKGRKIENYGKDDYYQAGGDFLVDRQGNLLFAHRSHDPSDRPSAGKLLEEVHKLKEKH